MKTWEPGTQLDAEIKFVSNLKKVVVVTAGEDVFTLLDTRHSIDPEKGMKVTIEFAKGSAGGFWRIVSS